MILTDGTTILTLPDDLYWPDELSFTPVAQQAEYSVSGALILHNSTRLAGRVITLESGDDFAWVSRADLEQLQSWADTAGQELDLTTPDNAAHHVIFNHHNGNAVEATPLQHRSPPDPDDQYKVTLKFFEI